METLQSHNMYVQFIFISMYKMNYPVYVPSYHRNVYKSRKINACKCYKMIQKFGHSYYVYIPALIINDICIMNRNVNKSIYLLRQRLLRPQFLESLSNILLCNYLSSIFLLAEIEVQSIEKDYKLIQFELSKGELAVR